MLRITDAMLPFVCLQPTGFCGPEEVAKAKPIYKRVFDARIRHVSFTDGRRGDHSPRQRKIWAEWTNATLEDSARHSVASILVLDSTLLRGALTALNWLAPPRVPQHVAGSIAEAVDIGRAIVASHGLVASPDTWVGLANWFEPGQARSAR